MDTTQETTTMPTEPTDNRTDDGTDETTDPRPAIVEIVRRVANSYYATPWQLARLADCYDPDAMDSAGAQFLTHARDRVRDLFEYDPESIADVIIENGGAAWTDIYDHLQCDGQLSTVADGAPDIYTATMWREFTDLGAWNEDPTELGVDGSDMEQAARVCLYMIAERCASAVGEEIVEQIAEEIETAGIEF